MTILPPLIAALFGLVSGAAFAQDEAALSAIKNAPHLATCRIERRENNRDVFLVTGNDADFPADENIVHRRKTKHMAPGDDDAQLEAALVVAAGARHQHHCHRTAADLDSLAPLEVDACCREEILAYAHALKGRRDKMYFGYSWHISESRFEEWRSTKKLQEGFDAGMKEAGLEYVDVWRISLLVDSSQHSQAEVVVSVTGIAGPGGGMPGKPVGLVHFGWSIGDQPVVCDSKVFEGERKSVRQQTVLYALRGIISRIDVQT